MFVWTGSAWTATGSAVNGTSARQVYTATASQTNFSATYDVGFVDVYLNGVKLVSNTDFTANDGTTIVLATGATAGDIIDIVAFGAFNIANTYTQAQSDARYLQLTGGTMTGTITFAAGQTLTGYLPTSGGTMTGNITFNAGQTFPGTLSTTGGTMTGNITFNAGQTFPGTASTGKAIAMAIVFGG